MSSGAGAAPQRGRLRNIVFLGYCYLYYLKDPVQGNEGAWPAHAGAAMDDDRSLLRAHALPDCAHESKIFKMMWTNQEPKS